MSSLGDVSDTRKKILQNTLEDELKEHFMLISQERFEEAQEKAFEELDYEECTEDQCIIKIQEMLQVENVFHLEVIGEGSDTQLSLSWRTLDEKRKETEYCEGCKTKELNEKVNGLVQKLIGLYDVLDENRITELEKTVGSEKYENQQKITDYKYFWDGSSWITEGNPSKEGYYEGEMKNGKRNGKGIFRLPEGSRFEGEFKDDKLWDISEYNGEKLVGTWKNGIKILIHEKKNELKSSIEPYFNKYFWNGFEWNTKGDPTKESYYVGELKNGKRNGQGKFRSMDGRLFRGEFKNDKLWNIEEYRKGKLISKWKDGIKDNINGLFVAVGEMGIILTSTDGIVWIKRGNGGISSLKSIVFGNNLYTAVGGRDSIISKDGIKWNTGNSILDKGGLNDVIFLNSNFISVGGFNGDGTGIILSSTDGLQWQRNASDFQSILHGVVYGMGLYVVVGQSGTILTSNNLNNWESRFSGYKETLHGVSFGKGLFVTVGGSLFSDSNGQILNSDDGIFWSSQHIYDKPFKDVVFGNGMFISVGGSIYAGSDGIIFKSTDGFKWEKVAVATKPLNSITFGNGLFTTVGQSGNIMTSNDGQVWTSRVSGTSRPLLDITYCY